MAELKEITNWLDNYLKIEDIEDYCWNGLQFEGKKEVKKIAFAVDACKETFTEAIDLGADFLIVHHGIFWKGTNPSIKETTKERIDILFKGNLSLYSAHLPLDRHKESGNNAQLIKILGGKILEEFSFKDGKNVGWTAKFKHKIPIHELKFILEKQLNAKCTILNFGNQKIEKLAVCSGGGSYNDFNEAMKKADAYLTGDSIEITQTAKDNKFNVIFAGHYATEITGVKALMPLIQKKFKTETIFIDKPTGL
jgi:dinuclear metal center YbgI/SA1388 family protein